MTVRTIQQYGLAYGSETLVITAKVDGSVVYSGPVTTVNEPRPSLPNRSFTVDNVLFSYTVPDVSWTGSQVLEITLETNANLIVAELSANYTSIPGPIGPGNVPGPNISSGANGFIALQWEQFGNTYINNTLQTVDHTQIVEIGRAHV